MENLIRQIRYSASMNQADFAREIGKSIQSLQRYESGVVPPYEVIEKLKHIAAFHGRADLANALSRDEWKAEKPTFRPRAAPSKAAPPAQDNQWQQMLQEVLDSGCQDAIEAVQQNLVVFRNHVRIRRKSAPAKSTKKTG